jgi:hypothetical protein
MKKNNDIAKLFETITGLSIDFSFENVVNSYKWSLMSDKKLRAKRRYLRSYLRNSAQKESAIRISKESICNPISLSMRSFLK